jgi:hypothetical protein
MSAHDDEPEDYAANPTPTLPIARGPRMTFRVSGTRTGETPRPTATTTDRPRLLGARRLGLRVHAALPVATPNTDDEAAS